MAIGCILPPALMLMLGFVAMASDPNGAVSMVTKVTAVIIPIAWSIFVAVAIFRLSRAERVLATKTYLLLLFFIFWGASSSLTYYMVTGFPYIEGNDWVKILSGVNRFAVFFVALSFMDRCFDDFVVLKSQFNVERS